MTPKASPLRSEDRLINVQAVPDALKQDFATTPPDTWLVGHVPWTEAEHRITRLQCRQARRGGSGD